jgi:hypothetical protein
MDWYKMFQVSLFPQANQKGFLEKSPGRDHGQKMRLIYDEDMFIFIKNRLNKWNPSFPLNLAVVKNAGSDTVTASCIQAKPGLIHHLPFCHPRQPGRGFYTWVSLSQKL